MKYFFIFSSLIYTQAMAWAPADDIPKPKPERCTYLAGSDDTPVGLSQIQVHKALNSVIQHALYCEQPKGMKAVNIAFEINIECRGLVDEITVIDDGGAPASYVTCVQEVIEKADFPGHDMEDGMMIAYPVNVSW